MSTRRATCIALFGDLAPCFSRAAVDAIEHRGYIAERSPTPQCHAATLAELPDGRLAAAWFGGSAEGKTDVRIWFARRTAGRWEAPRVVAEGEGLPCWNPVLCQPRDAPLRLFYKRGPNPRHWRGLQIASGDGGVRWSTPQRLPQGMLGPIRSRPLPGRDGRLLCPSSTESDDGRWRIHLESCDMHGGQWRRFPPIDDPLQLGAIQPSLVPHAGRILAFARSRSDRIATTRSDDGGRTWSPLAPTALPNPNAAVEALALADGRLLMAFNPRTRGRDWWDGRDRLDLAVSDDGAHWRHALTLEDEPGAEFSYPAALQSRDGRVHLAYTAKRTQLRHLVIDPARLA